MFKKQSKTLPWRKPQRNSRKKQLARVGVGLASAFVALTLRKRGPK